jgi:hypothetical protein
MAGVPQPIKPLSLADLPFKPYRPFRCAPVVLASGKKNLFDPPLQSLNRRRQHRARPVYSY